MIGNIIDMLTNSYNVNCDAIFESSSSDNQVKGATRFERGLYRIYHEINGTTVHDACAWANEQPEYVTVFLYDVGANCIVQSGENVHE